MIMFIFAKDLVCQVNYSQNKVIMKTKRVLIVALLLLGALPVSVAQTYSPNVITTTVPF